MDYIDEQTRDRLWDTKYVRWARLLISSFTVYLVFIVTEYLATRPPLVEAAAVCALAIGLAAAYLRVIWTGLPQPHTNRTPLTLTTLIVIALSLTPLTGKWWLLPAAYYSLAVLILSLKRRWWLVSTAATISSVLLLSTGFEMSGSERISLSLEIFVYAVVLMCFYLLIQFLIELGQARADLARMAVIEERLRFARDLHDLLGQRLSASVLKAQLAAKLVRLDPDRAIAEASEASSLARGALDDVRAAVSGYRESTLADELETACMLLRAAELRIRIEREDIHIPGQVDQLAGWVVREATTNVVRHARAQNCLISFNRVSREGVEWFRLEVSDDGRGALAGWGNGLNGLAERVRTGGGTLATVEKDGRFTVEALLPYGSSR